MNRFIVPATIMAAVLGAALAQAQAHAYPAGHPAMPGQTQHSHGYHHAYPGYHVKKTYHTGRHQPPQPQQGSGHQAPPRLGVALADLSDDALAQLGIELGVRVTAVQPGSAAERSGIQPGDVLTAIGDRPAYSPLRTQRLVREAPAKVTVDLLRDGETLRLQAALDRPDRAARPYLGVRIQDMTPALKEAFGAQDNLGVLISDVVDGTAAARAGLQAGDVVVSVGDRQVSSPAELMAAIGDHAANDTLGIAVLRDKTTQTVDVTLGAAPDSRNKRQGASVDHHAYGKPHHGMSGGECPWKKKQAMKGLRHS